MEEFIEFLGFLDFIDSIDNTILTKRPRHIRSRTTSTRKPRVIKSRANNFQNIKDNDFCNRYHMSKKTVLQVLNRIEGDLEFSNKKNQCVPPMNQLLITLRFLSTGTHLQVIADAHGVSVPTASRIVKKVSNAIAKMQTRYIKMPTTPEDIERCKRDFFNIAKFPFIIGCIGCTHVKIQSPGGSDGKVFKNRNGYYSLNVQTVCDARLNIRNVVAYSPGSTPNAAVFIGSTLCQQFESGVFGDSGLVGDSGYPLKNYLLTPYVHTSTSQQEEYNKSITKTTDTVDRLYGMLKRRFPVLALGLRVNLQTAVEVIVACCILHNICIDNGEDVPPNEMDSDSLDTHIANGQIKHIYCNPNEDRVEDEEKRNTITCDFFSCDSDNLYKINK